ncbi:MAG: helix-turn-helix transcriptional regulator [Cytophagales bacterium]|nr:helix-turn-helix transcriptional regulator [Cytophagales bacterium]
MPNLSFITLCLKELFPLTEYSTSYKLALAGELERAIPDVTPKMLVKVLKELEDEKLIVRKVYAEVPPRVEYSVTELGLSLNKLILEINKWGEYHLSHS